MNKKSKGKNETNDNKQVDISTKKTTKKTTKKKVKRQHPKHKKVEFARLYFSSKDKNATQAYIDAGYSPNGAWANASRMLKIDPVVKAEIKRLAAKQEKRLEIKADDVLNELLKSAMSDIRDLFDADGQMINPKDWPEHIARAVSSIKIDEIKEWDEKKRKHMHKGFTKQIKLWDKTASLRMLGQHLKLFNESVTLQMPDEFIDMMKEGQARLNERSKTS